MLIQNLAQGIHKSFFIKRIPFMSITNWKNNKIKTIIMPTKLIQIFNRIW